MTPEAVVELGRQALWTMLSCAAPMLIAGLLTGLLISILQAATQINEMTMTFVPKILTVFVVLILSLPWAIGQLTGFAEAMFQRIANM